MGDNIWGVLQAYAGRWVALDAQGRVINDGETLDETMQGVGPRAIALTFVFAAEPAGEQEAVKAPAWSGQLAPAA